MEKHGKIRIRTRGNMGRACSVHTWETWEGHGETWMKHGKDMGRTWEERVHEWAVG